MHDTASPMPDRLQKVAAASTVRIVKELRTLKDELEVLEGEEDRLLAARRVELEVQEQKRMQMQKEDEERRIKEAIELRNETEKLRKERLQHVREEQRREEAARLQRERQYQQLQWDLVHAKTGKELEKTIRKRKELDGERPTGQDAVAPEATESRAQLTNILDDMRRDLIELNASDWHKKQLILKRQAVEAARELEKAQAKAQRADGAGDAAQDPASNALPAMSDIRADLIALSDELLMLEREERVEMFRAKAKQEHWEEQKVLLDRHKQDMVVKSQRQLEQDQVEGRLEAEQSQQSIAEMEFVLAKQIGQLDVHKMFDGKRQLELEQLQQTLAAVRRLPKGLMAAVDAASPSLGSPIAPSTLPPVTPPCRTIPASEPATEPHRPSDSSPPAPKPVKGMVLFAPEPVLCADGAPATPGGEPGQPAVPKTPQELVELLQYDDTREQAAAHLARLREEACGTLTLEQALEFSREVSEENEDAVARLIADTQARLDQLREEQRRQRKTPSSYPATATPVDEQSISRPPTADDNPHAEAGAGPAALPCLGEDLREVEENVRDDRYKANMRCAADESQRVASEVVRLRGKLARLQQEEAAAQHRESLQRQTEVRQEIELEEYRVLDYNADRRYIRMDTAMLKQTSRQLERAARAEADAQLSKRQEEMHRAARAIQGFAWIIRAKKEAARRRAARQANLEHRELAGAALISQQAFRQKQAKREVDRRRQEIAEAREAQAREIFEALQHREKEQQAAAAAAAEAAAAAAAAEAAAEAVAAYEAAARGGFVVSAGCLTISVNNDPSATFPDGGAGAPFRLVLNVAVPTTAPTSNAEAQTDASGALPFEEEAIAVAAFRRKSTLQESRRGSVDFADDFEAESALAVGTEVVVQGCKGEDAPLNEQVGTVLGRRGTVVGVELADGRRVGLRPVYLRAVVKQQPASSPAAAAPRVEDAHDVRDVPRRSRDAEVFAAEERNARREKELAKEAAAEAAEQASRTAAVEAAVLDQQIATDELSTEAVAMLDVVANRQQEMEEGPPLQHEPIVGEAERLEVLEARIETLSRQIEEEREGHLVRERERAESIEKAKAQVIESLTSQRTEQARQIEELTELLEEHAELIAALRHQLAEATRYGPYEEDWVRGEAATRIQKNWRGKKTRTTVACRRLDAARKASDQHEAEAATVIQGAYRATKRPGSVSFH
eukprot:TRINITY_DN2169_c0_g1_i1.p1 TRINITY_DN2169_c0_g1~~TRINITY_DN2169_c0_g1_i1.p1  ORF type:complete len:1232 (+),score=494.42 TRINITY_DN2169_c0_g1_i1:116-3697(+)